MKIYKEETMKRKTRLALIIVLSLVFLFSAFAFVGCANKEVIDLTKVEASVGENMFKTNIKKYFVIESVIDIDDYIVKLDGMKDYSVHFNYIDDNGESKTDVVKGTTYYFMSKGTYEMVYTADVGGGYVRQSIELEVQGKGLSILTNKYPLIYAKDTEVLLKALTVNANPYCSATNEFKYEKVDFYQTAFDLDKTVNEETKYTKSLEGETKIKFDKAGTYDFTISCTADGEYASAIIKVAVVDESKKGNEEYVLKNELGEYASSNAEIDGNIVKLVQADYNAASYLALEGKYYDEDVIRVDFKGQNCPQIGLLTQPIEGAYNPYALYGGKGFTFSLEYSYRNMFSIWGDKATTGLGRFSGTNMHNGNSSTGYFGLENFDKDKYYTLEINLSTTSAPESVNIFRIAILEIENYGTSEESYKKVYPTAEQNAKYFEVPAGSSKDYESGNVVFYGSRYDDITFKIYKPTGRVDGFARNGNTVTWDQVEGVVYYVSTDGARYTMQTENSYTFTEFYENKTPLYVIAEKSEGYIAIDKASNNQKKYYNAAIYNNVLPEETVPYEDKDGEFIFANATDSEFSKSPDPQKTHINISLKKTGQQVFNYVRTKTEYDPGTYAIMSFKGSNFPGVVLFGTKEQTMSTEHDKTQGIGFYLDTNSGGRAYINTTPGGTATISQFGTKSYLDRGYLNSGHAAYFGEDVIAGNKIRNFVVVLGVENVEGGVELNYVLFREKYDESLELVQDMSYFIAGEQLEEGSIAVGATRHQDGTTFTYKWYQPQENLEAALAVVEDQYGMIYQRSPLDPNALEFIGNGGVSVNANGTYDTIVDDTYDTELSFVGATKVTYGKTSKTYAPGTYIMTEFLGANTPNGIFFGVQGIGGQETIENRWATTQIAGVGIISDDAMGASYFHKDVANISEATSGKLGGNGGKFSRGYFLGNEKNFPGSVEALNSERTYVLIAGADNTDSGVTVEYFLFEKESNEELIFIERRSQEIAGASMDEGYIAFNTSVNSRISPKFKLYTPDARVNVFELLEELYGFEYADPVLSSKDFITSGSTVGIQIDQNDTFNDTNDDTYIVKVPFISVKDMNYATTKMNYEPGTYILTEFKGGEFPNLIIFGTKGVTGTAVGVAGNGMTFGASGVTLYGDESNATYIYYKDAATTETPTNSTMMGLVKEGLYSRGYFYGNEGNYPGSTVNPDKTFVLMAGADNVETAIRVEYFLFEKNVETGELAFLQRMVKDIANAQMSAGGITFATSTDLAKSINVKLYVPNTRAEIFKLLDSEYGVKFFDPELSMEDFVGTGMSISVDQNNTFDNNDDDAYNVSISFGGGSKLNYARTKKNYAPGTYVLTEFVGLNFPTNIIFGSGDVIDGTIPTASNGALFAASGVGLYGDEAHNAFAYYKASATTTAATTTNMSSGTGNAFFCRGYFWENTGWFGSGVVGNKSKTYVLLAGTYNSDNGVVVEYSLYEKNTTANELIHLQTLSKELAGITASEGGIVFATSVDVGNPVKFKLYEPDTKEKLTEKLESLYTMPNA